MTKLFLASLTAVVMATGFSFTASAAPVAPAVATGSTAISSIQTVDYSWNRQHWHHRAWDKGHKRWRYYN